MVVTAEHKTKCVALLNTESVHRWNVHEEVEMNDDCQNFIQYRELVN